MDTTAYVSLSRAVALDRQMTALAQNIANAATSGYRAERMVFETVLERAGAGERIAFVQDRGPIRDRTDAPLIATGERLDLAIAGEGFFMVEAADGRRYTRAGHFQLDPQGRIATTDGALLLDADGGAIEIGEGARSISVAPDGTLDVDGQVVARIQPMLLPEASLVRVGGSRYVSDAAPVAAETSAVVQGAVLGSDVQPVMEMSRLIETQRAFEGAIRLIETHHDLVRRHIERAGGVQA